MFIFGAELSPQKTQGARAEKSLVRSGTFNAFAAPLG